MDTRPVPPPRRPIVAAIAVAVILGAGGAGCTDRFVDPDAPGSAVTPPTGARTSGVGEARENPDFPTTAQEYAEAAVGAWAAPDLSRLAELTTTQVLDEILGIPGPPDSFWTLLRCEPDDGSSDCGFYNADGDTLVLRVAHQSLGGPRAATTVTFDPTTFPDDHLDYLREFVAAWRDGNLARMNALARPAAVAAYQRLTPAAAEYSEVDVTDSRRTVRVRVPDGSVRTGLATELLGGPRAIVEAAPVPSASLTPAP